MNKTCGAGAAANGGPPSGDKSARFLSGVLDKIVSVKCKEIQAAKVRVPLHQIERQAARVPDPRPFTHELVRNQVALIAEIKRASPSRGDLAPNICPEALARVYARNGAACCSVLTDVHFKGTLDDLRRVRAIIDLPLLRKDFILDEYQIYEARAAGADAVLLIMSVLQEAETVHMLIELARRLGMDALVEVHDSLEVEKALVSGATLIGINNRNLNTFRVDRTTTARLRPLIPRDIPVVSESGILNATHVREVGKYGVQSVLVGEALVMASDPAAMTREMAGACRQSIDSRVHEYSLFEVDPDHTKDYA